MRDVIGIIGLGSAGERHTRNAVGLGLDVVGYDPGRKEGGSAAERVPLVAAVLDRKPLGVIVATPPDTHYSIGMQVLDAGIPALMEKPLTMETKTAEDLFKRFEWQIKKPLAVGYQLRHVASLRRLRERINVGDLGTIYALNAEFASQAWSSHTYPNDFLLECSHEFDLLRWVLNDAIPIEAHVGQLAGEIAFGTFHFKSLEWGLATFGLCGVAAGYHRRLIVYGTKARAEWTFDKAENDQAYVDELKDFLAVCRGEKAQPECTGRDGWWVLRMVEAIRKSADTGKWEAV